MSGLTAGNPTGCRVHLDGQMSNLGRGGLWLAGVVASQHQGPGPDSKARLAQASRKQAFQGGLGGRWEGR